jgi:hypothetical protein
LSFLDTKAPLILLYRDIASIPDAPRYDIMLTPQFYVSKRESLPVKYPFQAKKLAPSILDEIAGEGTCTYEAFKEGDAWVFVGYNLAKLAEFLEMKGGSIDRVRRIYFVEQVRERLVPPLELNDREALALVNDTATIVPKRLMENTSHFSVFSEEFRPEKHFDLKRNYNSFLDTRLSIVLASLLALLGLAYIVDGYRYQKAVGDAETKLESLLEANPSLRGTYARQSIHKKYTAINIAQRNIRDRIKDIAHLTGKDTKINALYVDTKGYRMTLSVPGDTKTVSSLKELAKSGRLEHLKINAGKLETWGAFQ